MCYLDEFINLPTKCIDIHTYSEQTSDKRKVIWMKKNKKIPMSVLRATKGVSQRQLAYDINVSPGLIGMYETGKRKTSLEKAIIIARYFNIPVENILFGRCEFAGRVTTNQTAAIKRLQKSVIK